MTQASYRQSVLTRTKSTASEGSRKETMWWRGPSYKVNRDESPAETECPSSACLNKRGGSDLAATSTSLVVPQKVDMFGDRASDGP
jgi:hypothetical protein